MHHETVIFLGLAFLHIAPRGMNHMRLQSPHFGTLYMTVPDNKLAYAKGWDATHIPRPSSSKDGSAFFDELQWTVQQELRRSLQKEMPNLKPYVKPASVSLLKKAVGVKNPLTPFHSIWVVLRDFTNVLTTTPSEFKAKKNEATIEGTLDNLFVGQNSIPSHKTFPALLQHSLHAFLATVNSSTNKTEVEGRGPHGPVPASEFQKIVGKVPPKTKQIALDVSFEETDAVRLKELQGKGHPHPVFRNYPKPKTEALQRNKDTAQLERHLMGVLQKKYPELSIRYEA